MKAIKYSAIGLGMVLAGALASCQDSYDAPEYVVPKADIEANTTIAELKSVFSQELAVQTPYKDEATKTPYIIHGRVISSDASGNIYKSLVIQDETGAMAFSVNQSSLYIDYPLGQDVVVNATDLWIGQYNDYVQFGWLGEYQGQPQITFMAYDIFKGHAQLNGNPVTNFTYINIGGESPKDNPYCVLTTISELNSIPAYSEDYYYVMSQLVELTNVRFVDAGKNPPVTFAPYQDNADRYITDASGAQLNVRCSGYSSFYNDPLPEGNGTVRGILSRYGDSWQLLLRGREDLDFSTKGTLGDPYTVEEAIALDNNGRTGWVKGVIVGSLTSGIQGAATLEDVIFTTQGAETDNNIVIAPTADCRDFSKMMAVNLPAGSYIRQYANLIDNPGVLGKTISVKGTMRAFEGMHGIVDIGDGPTPFDIDGVNIPGVTGLGKGTENKPFSPLFIVNNHIEEAGVWVEGYIVGYISGDDFEKGAKFELPAGYGSNYGGNNFVLGVAADTDSVDDAIPVYLSGDFRTDYNLNTAANQVNFRKHVLINCSIGLVDSFNAYGITSVSEIRVLSE